MAEKTGCAFSQVAGTSKKVGQLIDEVNTASGEQSQGIILINEAVSDINKVVQRNAAHAEESAAASNEMMDQASRLLIFVEKLTVVLEGGVEKKLTGKVDAPAFIGDEAM